MTLAEILEDLRTKPTTPIWPHYGWAYKRSRGATYKEAKAGLERGDPEFVRRGKSIRLVTAVTRKRLGIQEI